VSYSQLIYDKNGKKLSNKERKKLIKTREAEARAVEYEIQIAKASMEGAQFACSQTAVNEGEPKFFTVMFPLLSSAVHTQQKINDKMIPNGKTVLTLIFPASTLALPEKSYSRMHNSTSHMAGGMDWWDQTAKGRVPY
jgi:hypothetical protein